MLKHRLKSIVLSATTLVAIGTITVTTASCSQIDKTILDNQVKVGDNTLFATGYTLEDQIKAALKNTSNTAFSKTVVNQLLYN
jgi:tRNA(Ile)-lysidine synthase TilS/MesJ